jgi:hypothetical protein
MTRCVLVTVTVRDSEKDDDVPGLVVGYNHRLTYTTTVVSQVNETQPMLMERCCLAARAMAERLNGTNGGKRG